MRDAASLYLGFCIVLPSLLVDLLSSCFDAMFGWVSAINIPTHASNPSVSVLYSHAFLPLQPLRLFASCSFFPPLLFLFAFTYGSTQMKHDKPTRPSELALLPLL